jgi:hypothetical protein
MSSILRENAAWRSGKTPIIAKYSTEHAQLMSEIAGRGFLSMPGYAYDTENSLELSAKMKLSELNFKILSETVERELKQAGIDYDLSYKAAAIAWELEKQALMDAWSQELAGINQDKSGKEEELNQLAVEVGKRVIVLMEAKTAIDLQMEAYRLSLAQLDAGTASYEADLANAKLLTAQKKLDLIPILTEIVEKEQELLTIEQAKAGELTNYMNAEREVAVKTGTLTPFINELATKSEELATKITTVQEPLEEKIADEKVSQAEAIVEKSGFQVDEINKNIEVDAKQLELAAAKRNLQITEFNNEQEVIGREISLTGAHQNAVTSDNATGLQNERATATYILDKKVSINDDKNDIRITSAGKSADSQMYLSNADAGYSAASDVAIAEINATPKLTASLTHLLA